ncbi:hypothetical protein GCM10022277_34850 [Litoribacillus peritrichatus]|uniref:Solute-binding protein family 3/N-terminal domain-containing protein n=1 Tax=Litoribacillus peritrichatus TaxID=718191 RepID=A0ABP7N2J7_9GAMM
MVLIDLRSVLKKVISNSIAASSLLVLSLSPVVYAGSPYVWYTFNIPPFGSPEKVGIGYDLAHAYIEAGFNNKIVLANAARWQRDMQDPENDRFCSSGSWKLPDTDHRVYSDSIMNTVDYGVAARPEVYQLLSNNGATRIASIRDVIRDSHDLRRLLIINGRPVFGLMGDLIKTTKTGDIRYMTAAQGPVSLLRMANTPGRKVGSVLVFPEEFQNFTRLFPDHDLEYMMLSEGVNFAPIRASCPDTPEGRKIIAAINQLLDDGLRDKTFQSFLNVLPDFKEIREQAYANQRCIQDDTCQDPLTNLINRE